MNSIQINIQCSEAQQEILISQLSDYHVQGFEQRDGELVAYFSEVNFDSYAVNNLLKNFTHHTSTVEERNWNAEWEQNFQPVVVDEFCAVRAAFHQPIAGVKYEIIITPKMSFGTGHHATTYMMIKQMEAIDFKGKSVFDFGTGTGILAILAKMLGAAGVEAIDIDEWSIENAAENAMVNGCDDIDLKLSTELPAGPFDVILANINRNVILDYLPLLGAVSTDDCRLLLSGLLSSDEHDIHAACAAGGWVQVRKMERNNWISLLYVKQL